MRSQSQKIVLIQFIIIYQVEMEMHLKKNDTI